MPKRKEQERPAIVRMQKVELTKGMVLVDGPKRMPQIIIIK